MPTITFTAWGQRSGDTLALRVELESGAVIERTVTWAKVNTPEKLAAWVLAQAQPPGVDAGELRRKVTVTYHTDGHDPQLIIDQVTTALPSEDVEFAGLLAGPLGAVTVAQALTTIDAAQSLSDFKTILRHLARVVIPLRNIVEQMLALLRRVGVR